MVRYCLMMGLSILTIFFTVSVNAAQFIKGKDYIEIQADVTKEPQIRAFYSYYCPHCFKQEPFILQLKQLLPEGQTVLSNPVDGMPGQNINIEQALIKATIAADILGMAETMNAAFFDYIHVQRAAFTSEKDIKNLFLLHGADEALLDKTLASFALNTRYKQLQHATKQLRKQGINTVPTLIINGKYKPETQHIKSLAHYNELVAYLLTKTVH